MMQNTTNSNTNVRLWRALGLAAAAAIISIAGCDRAAPTTAQNKPINTTAATVPAAAHTPAVADAPATPAATPAAPAQAAPATGNPRPKPISMGAGASAGGSAKAMTASSMQAIGDPGVQTAPGATAPAPVAPGVTPPAPTAPADAPKLTLEKTFIDFGTVYKDDPVTSPIKYTNEGKSVLTNIEFRPSCGCTVVQGYKTVLNPGETADVNITFNPKGHPGKNAKSVTVSSSDPLAPQQVIRFECDYVPLVQLSPPVVQFGTVVAGNEGKALLTITSRDKNFKITKIDTGNALITAQTTDDDLKSEDPNYPGRQVYEFVLKKDAPTGSLSSTATLTIEASPEPNDPNVKPQEITMTASVIAHVLGDMVIEPRFIRVAQAFPGQKFSEKVLVTSASGKDFNITGATVVESTLPGVSVRTEPVNTGGLKGHYLILEGTGNDTLGMFRGYVEVKSDLPNESAIRVQFNGFIREKPAGENQ